MEIITRQDRAVDKVQDLESRVQWFESQARQLNFVPFGLTYIIKTVDFKKTMQFGLLTNLKWFYIVDKRNNQFWFFVHPFLFSV